MGMLPRALRDAPVLADEEPPVQNLLSLAKLCFVHGDLKRPVIVGRQLATHRDASAEECLRVGAWVRSEDRPVASSLWRLAMEKGIPDSAVTTAVVLSFNLGLDAENGPLLQRLTSLAASAAGGVEAVTIRDAVECRAHA